MPRNQKTAARKGRVKITICNFQKEIPVNTKRIKKTALDILSCEGIEKAGEINVFFVTDSGIRELNRRYSGKDKATDVLAFDITMPFDTKNIFADIVISTQTALRNAGIFKTTPSYESRLYVIHGILHILGYKDHTPAQKELMQRKEFRYVNT